MNLIQQIYNKVKIVSNLGISKTLINRSQLQLIQRTCIYPYNSIKSLLHNEAKRVTTKRRTMGPRCVKTPEHTEPLNPSDWKTFQRSSAMHVSAPFLLSYHYCSPFQDTIATHKRHKTGYNIHQT